jgi:hypothetical protein
MNQKERGIHWSGWGLMAGSICVAAVFVIAASKRDLTSLENVLLQLATFGLGIAGSYVLGRDSAKAGARELVEPHARSAFRRLLALYGGLSRLAVVIDRAKPANGQAVVPSSVLERLEGMVIEQIQTSNDALEDWRDIVPDEVNEIQSRIDAQRQGGRSE